MDLHVLMLSACVLKPAVDYKYIFLWRVPNDASEFACLFSLFFSSSFFIRSFPLCKLLLQSACYSHRGENKSLCLVMVGEELGQVTCLILGHFTTYHWLQLDTGL